MLNLLLFVKSKLIECFHKTIAATNSFALLLVVKLVLLLVALSEERIKAYLEERVELQIIPSFFIVYSLKNK